MHAIEARRVWKLFGKTEALRGITLSIDSGMNIILWPNGAGKSTLLRCIDGLHRVDHGSIRVNGLDPYTNEGVHEKLSLLTDNYALYDHLTVIDNLRFFGRLYGMPDSDIRIKSKSLLKEVGALEYSDKKVAALSRGTKQKVAFCRAVLNDPKMILLDEPTAFLDVEASESIRRHLMEKEREGAVVIFVTQKVDEVTRFNANIFIMRNGRIAANVNSAELYRKILKGSIIGIRLARPISASAINNMEGLEYVNSNRATYIRVRIDSPSGVNKALKELMARGAVIAGVDYTEPPIEKISFG